LQSLTAALATLLVKAQETPFLQKREPFNRVFRRKDYLFHRSIGDETASGDRFSRRQRSASNNGLAVFCPRWKKQRQAPENARLETSIPNRTIFLLNYDSYFCGAELPGLWTHLASSRTATRGKGSLLSLSRDVYHDRITATFRLRPSFGWRLDGGSSQQGERLVATVGTAAPSGENIARPYFAVAKDAFRAFRCARVRRSALHEEGHAMPEQPRLTKPWLVAVWPGMGHVAISAGYYLMSKLHMHLLAEMTAQELFDIDHVDVEDGVIQPGRLPRSRFFVWRDPKQQHDIVVFIGEAQPPLGKYLFCRRLMEYARSIGVERVFTFAAMATQMNLDDPVHVFGTASSKELLTELTKHDADTLEEGRISGLNGVLVAAAMEVKLPAACLLGEMPHIFAQFPFPQASLAVLRTFSKLTGVAIELDELEEQAEAVGQKLAQLLQQMEQNLLHQESGEEEAETLFPEQEGLRAEEHQHIERLFQESKRNRSKAYELKSELDRLGVFSDYEDRFLDLFKPD
jgi:proteasome assembly chaperone (PAC2) family protein